MRNYSYRVIFSDGSAVEVDGFGWSEAVILAAAQRIRDGKRVEIERVDMDKSDRGDWVQVQGPVTINLDISKEAK